MERLVVCLHAILKLGNDGITFPVCNAFYSENKRITVSSLGT